MYPGIFTARNGRSGYAWNVVSAKWGASAHLKNDNWNAQNSFPKSIDFMFFGDVPWAPSSPDLSPIDSFLWEYLIGKVYIDRLCDLDELEENIIQEFRNLTYDILRKVV